MLRQSDCENNCCCSSGGVQVLAVWVNSFFVLFCEASALARRLEEVDESVLSDGRACCPTQKKRPPAHAATACCGLQELPLLGREHWSKLRADSREPEYPEAGGEGAGGGGVVSFVQNNWNKQE